MLSDEARKDGGLTDEEVARSLEIASATVERIRRRCVEEGIEAALGRKEQQRRRPKKLDGAAEAHLIALACGEPPEGRARWTLRLLADRLVECEIVESIHPETVRQTLKKTNSSPRSATGQALAERVLVHPAARQRRVRLCDGRRAGSLSAPVWGQRSSGLLGRDQQATGERDAPAASGPAWGGGLLRLRIRAQRGEQPFHVVRSAGRVAKGRQ